MSKYYTIRIIVEEVEPSKVSTVVFRSPDIGKVTTLQEAAFLAGSASAQIIHDLSLSGMFE